MKVKTYRRSILKGALLAPFAPLLAKIKPAPLAPALKPSGDAIFERYKALCREKERNLWKAVCKGKGAELWEYPR